MRKRVVNSKVVTPCTLLALRPTHTYITGDLQALQTALLQDLRTYSSLSRMCMSRNSYLSPNVETILDQICHGITSLSKLREGCPTVQLSARNINFIQVIYHTSPLKYLNQLYISAAGRVSASLFTPGSGWWVCLCAVCLTESGYYGTGRWSASPHKAHRNVSRELTT